MTRLASAVIFGPAALWGAVSLVGIAASFADAAAWGPVDRGGSRVVGSETCRACHLEEHATWSRTYHRTMTQRAAGEAVLAPFSGETLDDLGFRATMTRTSEGVPHVRVVSLFDPEAEPLLDVDVDLTVGSHRYQQYVARIDQGGGPLERWRLPVAWHIGEARWIPMRAAFLTPDGTPNVAADYLRHLSRWSDNCIFCHNTEPAPGLREGGTFQPEIGELGIACEACHGPASAHVARHRDPIRRLLAATDDAESEGSILHPERLDPGLSSDVCGRCHGQRIGRDIAEILAHGDGFLPGEPLSAVSRPIFADSALAGEPPGTFAARFWPDGTPRLSAYEYQGLLTSPCHDEGKGLACGDCHAMHDSDPDMQLAAGYDGDRVCARCHAPAALSNAAASGGHGGHGDAVDCAGCHLPRTTYGLLTGMQSHRITVPDPAGALGHGDRPDACTQCHVDRSRAWAATAMGAPTGEELEPFDTAPRIAVDLLGGDPIQRALATHALARPEATGSASMRAAWLVDALDDDYPAVRWMAARALDRLAAAPDGPGIADVIARYDPLADPVERLPVVEALRQRLGPGVLAGDPDARDALLLARDDVEIWIGE